MASHSHIHTLSWQQKASGMGSSGCPRLGQTPQTRTLGLPANGTGRLHTGCPALAMLGTKAHPCDRAEARSKDWSPGTLTGLSPMTSTQALTQWPPLWRTATALAFRGVLFTYLLLIWGQEPQMGKGREAAFEQRRISHKEPSGPGCGC